jgi:hypothetical protein
MPSMMMVGGTRSAIEGDWFVGPDDPDDREIRFTFPRNDAGAIANRELRAIQLARICSMPRIVE